MSTRPPILLRPIEDIDPRLHAEPRDLVLASRNAYPLVAQQGKKSDSTGLVAGAGIALLLGGVTFWSMSAHRTPPAPKPEMLAPVAPPPVLAPVVPYQATRPAPLPFAAPQVSAPAVAAAASPAMVIDNSQAPGGQTASIAAAVPAKTGDGKTAITGDDNDQFALRVGGTSDVATAEPMRSPSLTVTQGTLIPAVLETAIDTDLPGYVRAVVSRDVRGFDGSKVLIPRSSRLIGQYKSGLADGQTRAYVIWSRLIRPDGVSVALGSPAVDFEGRSGLGGKVDSHFLKRFGSAVLLSVVGGLSAISNASVVVSGGQSAASVAAQNDTKIAPTVRVPQGQPIRVFTARDLDFSTASAGG
ncbi:TrbI/VirB10 family protein [uncultured Sphingomonas sp.]|uniref:TrbI/VirB10 family protein n=1 Tax=uncultured Sphingomonas sp. TaxID=158754 RepID=UPI002601E3DE|nr:TrbI/VirB10 family protein [uncultured Sphingomonas sp.]